MKQAWLGAALLVALAGLCLPAQALDTAPDRVERAVEAVFEQRALREGLESPDSRSSDLLAVVKTKARELLENLQGWFRDLYRVSPFKAWFFVIVLGLVLVLLLAHIAWTLSLAFRKTPRERDRGDGRDSAAAEVSRARRYGELKQEAIRLAESGDLRGATRTLLLALLAFLEQRNVLAVAQGWTNREVLTRLRLRTGLSEDLDSFGLGVDAVWYGGHTATRADFDRLHATLERLAGDLKSRAA